MYRCHLIINGRICQPPKILNYFLWKIVRKGGRKNANLRHKNIWLFLKDMIKCCQYFKGCDEDGTAVLVFRESAVGASWQPEAIIPITSEPEHRVKSQMLPGAPVTGIGLVGVWRWRRKAVIWVVPRVILLVSRFVLEAIFLFLAPLKKHLKKHFQRMPLPGSIKR